MRGSATWRISSCGLMGPNILIDVPERRSFAG